MLQAQLRGKLRYAQENLEDLLTSSVFGTLKYLAPEDGLCALLACARAGDVTDLRRILADRPFRDVTYEFWPWLQEEDPGCEPDVLITIRTQGGRLARVLIEAKYRSGKSSQELANGEPTAPPMDQLAREWSNLALRCHHDDAVPILVYLTADPSPPHADLESSQAELLRKGRTRGTFAWLSWRDCAPALSSLPDRMIADLCRMLRDRYGFTRFDGVTAPARATSAWAFADEGARKRAAIATTFEWTPTLMRGVWQFDRATSQAFAWPRGIVMSWRMG